MAYAFEPGTLAIGAVSDTVENSGARDWELSKWNDENREAEGVTGCGGMPAARSRQMLEEEDVMDATAYSVWSSNLLEVRQQASAWRQRRGRACANEAR